MLLVQKFLETHSFKELQEQHGVYASFSKSGHKFSLNYDQIEAKEADPLAQECRGLILSCENGVSLLPQALTLPEQKTSYDLLCPGKTTVLAYPMKRFFNYSQGAAADVNWSDPGLAVLEKLDGTLCIVYWDKFINQWYVATRSVPEADLLMDNGIYTFRTLFEKALTETTGYTFDVFTRYLDKAYTYCFELTTPYNRIVVEYKNCGITLLAVRGLVTGQEVSMTHPVIDLLPTSLPLVQAHTYTSVQALVDWVSTLNPLEHEGVVVRDSQFNRIKVKNAAYVAYNKLNDRLGSSERNLMEFILLEKDDDVAGVLPEEIVKNMNVLKEGLQKAIMKYDSMYHLITLNLSALGLSNNKKEFALYVQKHKELWQAPFFAMFDGKASNMKDFIMKNRKDGTWGSSFLDKMLEVSKN